MAMPSTYKFRLARDVEKEKVNVFAFPQADNDSFVVYYSDVILVAGQLLAEAILVGGSIVKDVEAEDIRRLDSGHNHRQGEEEIFDKLIVAHILEELSQSFAGFGLQLYHRYVVFVVEGQVVSLSKGSFEQLLLFNVHLVWFMLQELAQSTQHLCI